MRPMPPAAPCAALLLVLTLWAGIAPAATYLWDGGGSDDNIFTAQNWASDIAPSSGGNHLLQFIGPNRPTPYNLSMMFLSGIEFPLWSAKTPFTLSGARLHIGSDGIQNDNGVTQTIGNAVTLVAGQSHPQIWGSSSGTLVLNGDLELEDNELLLSGDFVMAGNVTGTNAFVKVGGPVGGFHTGHLTLSGNMNVDLDIQQGTLAIDTDQPQPDYTTLQFSDGSSFEALGTHNITQALQLTGTVTYRGTGTLRSEQALTGSGNLVVHGDISSVLGLGPTNNITPFSGDVTVKKGTLELNGGGVIAQLDGSLEVGQAGIIGPAAFLLAPNSGVVSQGVPLVIRRSGYVDLAGAMSFASLGIFGGDLVAGGPVTVDTITTGGSGATATLDAVWSVPSRPAAYSIDATDGSANPDLRLLQGAAGGGHVVITGTGEVAFEGSAADGPGQLTVNGPTAILDRTGSPPALTSVSVGAGTLRTAASYQLSPGTAVEIGGGATLDLGPNQEEAQTVYLEGGQILGTGSLTLHDDLIVFDGGTVEPTLSFAVPAAEIGIEPGTELVCGFLDGTAISLVAGGILTPEEINCDLTVAQGTLRFQGFVDGDLTVDDRLVVLRDAGVINVNGVLTCGASSTLDVQLDLSGAAAGDSWVLMNTSSVAGSFGSVEFPTPPAGHYLYLEYVGNAIVLHLEAIDSAVLDFEHGANGLNSPLSESLNGVVGVDFTVQGFDDVEICSVTVDGLTTSGSDGTAGIRLYDASTGNLIDAKQQFVARSASVESRTFAFANLLQPLETYRLVLYGSGGLAWQAFLPNREFPYSQSTLVNVDGAWLDQSSQDVFPTAPTDQFPQFSIALGPCDPTAAPETPVRHELALEVRPNPFNPATTVSFELPQAGPVSVDVFDARGRRVATLLEEHRPAGAFDMRWDGRDDRGAGLSSGVYFLKLTHPSGQKVRRVTLLK